MKKFLLWLFVGIILLITSLVVYVFAAGNRTYKAPYPDIKASTDSTVIARGKYLAFGPAHCSACHAPMDKLKAVDAGLEMPLMGGWELNIPPGTFRAPNLTPDMETGIGKLTDTEIARVMRHSVGHDGRNIFPFMPFQDMSDADLTAIISFLRSQEPVKNAVPRTELSFLGKAINAFGLMKPIGPTETPPSAVTIAPTVAYGKYIANSVANCRGCHTNRDLKTGEFIGEEYAGGLYFEPDPLSEGYSFVAPNLTPDKQTGLIAEWEESTFLTRFKNGRVHSGSPMPWGAFSRMDTVEIVAIYRYLKSLKPVENKVEKIVFAPREAMK